MVNENNRLPIDRLKKNLKESRPEGSEPISPEALLQLRRAIGKRIFEAFGGEERVNQSDIARALNSSSPVVGNYLNGDRFPPVDILIKIRNKTGCSIDWLLTGETKQTVGIQNLFTTEEENQIRELAGGVGRIFSEEVHRLALAGKEAIEKYHD